jgi:flagellar biosynthesis/type III secretory pathway protein FliH
MARVIRADRSGPTVLPAAVADAVERARAIVQRAEALAEAIREDALQRARGQARAELAAQLLQLAAGRDEQLAALEPQVVELALLAARRIIGEELTVRPARVADMVAPLLARVRRARQVTLRAHPDDRAQLEACLAPLRARSELSGSLALESDPQLARGDCVVISDAGVLDARIDTQLDALARALGTK